MYRSVGGGGIFRIGRGGVDWLRHLRCTYLPTYLPTYLYTNRNELSLLNPFFLSGFFFLVYDLSLITYHLLLITYHLLFTHSEKLRRKKGTRNQ